MKATRERVRTPKASRNGFAAFSDFGTKYFGSAMRPRIVFICLSLRFLQFLMDLFFFAAYVAKMTLEKR
jgi:hypothetical protein